MDQREMGDPNDIEEPPVHQDHDDDNEVILVPEVPTQVQGDLPMRLVKAWMTVEQKVMLTIMFRHLVIKEVDQMDL